ncbi:oxidoreductase (plasmid) [Rhizobium sp. ACO-34A]|nr:NAD(P)-dependent oxidoreductase [Rhizobium sp. ACO-34A]ATN36842.1 oxidoreductase [Rhizobium sp. ACO-34A]
MKDSIGFIGLGVMGLPMLSNLARSGHSRIFAYDTSSEPFNILRQEPAFNHTLFQADDPGCFEQCSVVITMLPNSRITNAAILGEGETQGLAHILARGSTIIDMGSSDPAETLKLIPILSERGIRLVDAPVSGAAAKARTGELSIMIGGDQECVEEFRPILSSMGRQLIAAGKPSAAHAMKALNNYVYAAGLLAASEAVAIAEAMQLDTELFTDILNASSGRNVATETKLKPFILPRHYAGGFALALQAKDLAIASGLQSLAGMEAPQLDLCASLWAEALATLPAGSDNTAIHRFIRERKPH